MRRRAYALAFAVSSTPVGDPAITEQPLTLPPYVVLLHNDDVNTMDHVVQSLLASVPELNVEQAIAIMMSAPTEGRAAVIHCPLERAELYRDRLERYGLTAMIERG